MLSVHKSKLREDHDSTGSKTNDDEPNPIQQQIMQALYQKELDKVKAQDQQLEEFQQQIEKLTTVEQFLDDNIDGDMAVQMAGLTYSSDKPKQK